MVSKVMKIDKEKCIGCGLCVNACQESAIELVGELSYAVQKALMHSNKMIPWQIVTLASDGSIIDR